MLSKKCGRKISQQSNDCGGEEAFGQSMPGQPMARTPQCPSKFAAHQMRFEFILFRTPSSLPSASSLLSLPVEKRNFSRLVAFSVRWEERNRLRPLLLSSLYASFSQFLFLARIWSYFKSFSLSAFLACSLLLMPQSQNGNLSRFAWKLRKLK